MDLFNNTKVEELEDAVERLKEDLAEASQTAEMNLQLTIGRFSRTDERTKTLTKRNKGVDMQIYALWKKVDELQAEAFMKSTHET